MAAELSGTYSGHGLRRCFPSTRGACSDVTHCLTQTMDVSSRAKGSATEHAGMHTRLFAPRRTGCCCSPFARASSARAGPARGAPGHLCPSRTLRGGSRDSDARRRLSPSNQGWCAQLDPAPAPLCWSVHLLHLPSLPLPLSGFCAEFPRCVYPPCCPCAGFQRAGVGCDVAG